MPNLNPHGRSSGLVNAGADYTGDEVEFMLAIEHWKRARHQPFPTWCDVLNVVLALGYRKVTEPVAIAGLTLKDIAECSAGR